MKKIILQRNDNKILSCVLKGENLRDEFNIFLFGKALPDGGYSARFDGETLEIIDYISFDTVTTFKVLSIAETDEEESRSWTEEHKTNYCV